MGVNMETARFFKQDFEVISSRVLNFSMLISSNGAFQSKKGQS